MFKEIPSKHAYRLLESGPIVLVTTRKADRNNVMTMGFHMMVQHDPALVACVIGPWDYSFDALRSSGECVLALPTADMAEIVTKIGNCSGQDVDKFDRFGLTALPAASVGAPLIEQCAANLECRVVDDTLAGRYQLHILEVTRIWVAGEGHEATLIHHAGDGEFIADGERINMRKHMTKWRDLMD